MLRQEPGGRIKPSFLQALSEQAPRLPHARLSKNRMWPTQQNKPLKISRLCSVSRHGGIQTYPVRISRRILKLESSTLTTFNPNSHSGPFYHWWSLYHWAAPANHCSEETSVAITGRWVSTAGGKPLWTGFMGAKMWPLLHQQYARSPAWQTNTQPIVSVR